MPKRDYLCTIQRLMPGSPERSLQWRVELARILSGEKRLERDAAEAQEVSKDDEICIKN